MAAISESTMRKFTAARLTLKQLEGMGPNLSGVYYIVGKQAAELLNEAVAEAKAAWEQG